MNPENDYGFQQLVDLCKQTHQEMQRQISQTLSSVSCIDDISQLFADLSLRDHINLLELGGIIMQSFGGEHL